MPFASFLDISPTLTAFKLYGTPHTGTQLCVWILHPQLNYTFLTSEIAEFCTIYNIPTITVAHDKVLKNNEVNTKEYKR